METETAFDDLRSYVETLRSRVSKHCLNINPFEITSVQSLEVVDVDAPGPERVYKNIHFYINHRLDDQYDAMDTLTENDLCAIHVGCGMELPPYLGRDDDFFIACLEIAPKYMKERDAYWVKEKKFKPGREEEVRLYHFLERRQTRINHKMLELTGIMNGLDRTRASITASYTKVEEAYEKAAKSFKLLLKETEKMGKEFDEIGRRKKIQPKGSYRLRIRKQKKVFSLDEDDEIIYTSVSE